jgi:hypothetical protein
MNTAKILDIVPQGTPAPAQPPPAPQRSPQAVPATPSDGAASDALRKHAERQAEAAAEAERKRPAKAEPRPQNFSREVGRVGDSFQVFVDLVSPSLKSHRFRIFGPPDNPAPPPPPVPTSDPASAHAAYAGSGAKPPVVKTDV